MITLRNEVDFDLQEAIDLSEQKFKWNSALVCDQDLLNPKHSCVEMARWNPKFPVSKKNFVLLTKAEVLKHEKL